MRPGWNVTALDQLGPTATEGGRTRTIVVCFWVPARFSAGLREKGPDMSTPSMPKEADAAAQRVKELSDRMIELSKKNGLAWLEAYEKVLSNMLQLQQRAIASSQIEWINALATTNANFMRDMSAAYFKTVREGLK
jgi:hypothetical protein